MENDNAMMVENDSFWETAPELDSDEFLKEFLHGENNSVPSNTLVGANETSNSNVPLTFENFVHGAVQNPDCMIQIYSQILMAKEKQEKKNQKREARQGRKKINVEPPVNLSFYNTSQLKSMKENCVKSILEFRKRFVGRLVHLLENPNHVGRIVYVDFYKDPKILKSTLEKKGTSKWLFSAEYNECTRAVPTVPHKGSFIEVRIRYPLNSTYIHSGFSSLYEFMEKVDGKNSSCDPLESKYKLGFVGKNRTFIPVSKIFTNSILAGIHRYVYDESLLKKPRFDKKKKKFDQYLVYPCYSQMNQGIQGPAVEFLPDQFKNQESIQQLCSDYLSDDDYPAKDKMKNNASIACWNPEEKCPHIPKKISNAKSTQNQQPPTEFSKNSLSKLYLPPQPSSASILLPPPPPPLSESLFTPIETSYLDLADLSDLECLIATEKIGEPKIQLDMPSQNSFESYSSQISNENVSFISKKMKQNLLLCIPLECEFLCGDDRKKSRVYEQIKQF